MKKTQIVLGLNAFILAIAAAFDTKASTNLAAIPATLLTVNKDHCEGAALSSCVTTGIMKCRTPNSNVQTMRTARCTQTLYSL